MSWKTATDALAEALPGYESRAEQNRLALTIEDAMADRVHLLAQAGCGTGKSFAYLVGAAFRAKETGKPVVVATATKALQAQLADKDLPFLASIFPWLRFAVVKGRGNYACLAKLSEDSAGAVPNIDAIRAELNEEGHSGDLDTLRAELAPQHRGLLAVVGEECPGKNDCPLSDACYAERAKLDAQNAHIVVVNHAVLLRDIDIKNMTNGKAGMLPFYDTLIIDEAHELEEYATTALGVEFGQRALERLADDIAVFLRDTNIAANLRRAARDLFARLAHTFGDHRDNSLRLTDELLIEIFTELEAVHNETKRLGEAVRAVRPENEDHGLAKKRAARRVGGMLDRLTRVVMADGDTIVRWIERESRVYRGRQEVTFKLAFAPLHVGPHLRDCLWEHVSTTLVSATLATGDGDFSYIAGRLGFESYQSFDAGSPFDFTAQAALYVPTARKLKGDFPNDPKDADWSGRVIAETGELIAAAGGRALLLYTSRREMDAAHTALLPKLQKMGVTVLRQGDRPNGQLAQAFNEDETSVLFALKSFMTGADFQGDTLRLVVINKMPFPVPTDVVFAARAEAIDATKTSWNTGSFMKLSVPMMVLTLLQAFGRAIRTKSDEALVAIFDPRLRTSGYGKGILRALPDARDLGSRAEAEAYLRELAARRG
jgi:ATP-dependent DNA helicase DinG